MILNYENRYKKGGIFDILKYRGLILHTATWTILPILMWYIPQELNFSSNSIKLWQFISIYSALMMLGMSVYSILLKICKDNYPNTFKKIAPKPYLKFIEKDYYDV